MYKETLYNVKLTYQQCLDLATLLGDEAAKRVEGLEIAKEQGHDFKGELKEHYDHDTREIKVARDVLKMLIKITKVQLVAEALIKNLEKEI
jgi:hypothetical protein